MEFIASYNKVVNITNNEKDNGINFIESLEYNDKIITFLKAIKEVFGDEDIEILPSFVGQALINKGFPLEYEGQDKGKVFIIKDNNYDDKLLQKLNMSYSKENGSIIFYL